MPYKVTELDGLAGILMARHTVGRLSLSRDEQVGFYQKCDSVLPSLSYQLHRLQADGTWKEAEARSCRASTVLIQGRINDEGTDPQWFAFYDPAAKTLGI